MVDSKICMLLGEDNYAELKLFEIASQESGLSQLVNIESASDGDEVISKLTEALDNGKPYDLLILDLNMPKTSGLAVLQHMQGTNYPRKPTTIILTNSDNPMDLLACKQNGADAYLQKPADFHEIEDFCRTIKDCLELNEGVSIDFIRMNYRGLH